MSSITSPAIARPRHDPEYLLALIGFVRSPGPRAIRMMTAASVKPVEIADPVEAGRLLETLAFDAVALDTQHSALGRISRDVLAILEATSSGAETSNATRTRVLVWASAGLSRGTRYVYEEAGATIIPSGRRSFKHLVNVVRRQT